MIALLLLLALPLPSHAEAIERAGDWLQVLLPVGGWAMTHAYDDPEGRGQFYRSFATTFVTTHALKLAIPAQRPNDGAFNSFPSGHTSAAFSGAAFLQHRYGWAWGGPAYLAASFVGYSRVHAEAHYPLDVVAGAALAYASSRYFTTPYKDTLVTAYAVRDRATLLINHRF